MNIKKLFHVLFFAAFMVQVAPAQCPQETYVRFNSQADIDNFAANYPNCTEIEKQVIIAEDTLGAITNLIGLSQITRYYFLTVNNTSLVNLQGLENVTAVTGDLSIGQSTELNDISSLANLARVEKNCSFYELPKLTSLTGLEKLEFVGGNFSVKQCELLNNLKGLEALRDVSSGTSPGCGNHASIHIQENPNLETLEGFENLEKTLGCIYISRNPKLHSLAGLHNLTSIGGTLYIDENVMLTNLSELEKLEAVDGLSIQGNTSLRSLKGLRNVKSSLSAIGIYENNTLLTLNGLENIEEIRVAFRIQKNGALVDITALDQAVIEDLWILEINDNPVLEVCNNSNICSYLINGGDYTVSDNAPGCNDFVELTSTCNEYGKVNFEIFYDANQNKIRDADEFIYPDASVYIDPGALLHFPNDEDGDLCF